VSDNCTDEYTATIRVQEVDARFTVSDTVVCNFSTGGQSNLVEFEHTNIPDPIWEGNWTFYNGASPSKYAGTKAFWKYTEPGRMTASLEVTTTYGCKDIAYQDILVNGTRGDFAVSRNEICIEDEVQFYPLGLENVDSLIWVFDDGFASNDNSKKNQ